MNFKFLKKNPEKKLLKNTLFAKKGGYSIALTAMVLVGIIVFNVLVTALSNRFVLEFDMTAQKQNSISEENIEYIKSIDKEVDIIVCATKDGYAGYATAVGEQYYSVMSDTPSTHYFNQTIKLIEKYGEYNDKINVRFMDTQSSEFTEIASVYGTEDLEAGGIIVSTTREDGTVRFKKLGYGDIYELREDDSYASYGITTAEIVGNNIETALTGAVAYALSNKDVKVALYTGHSTNDLTAGYKELLKKNNYTVDVITDSVLGKISNTYDVFVIAAPTTDFIESELNEIATFLKNDGKLEKGLMVFADASAPYLTSLYSYLNEWGIEISDGILYETNESYHVVDEPTTFVSQNTGKIKDLASMKVTLTGNNVPMKSLWDDKKDSKTIPVVQTLETTVKAPKGVSANWDGAKEAEAGPYSLIVESSQIAYDDDNNLIESTVTVFSSSYFLMSDYNETEAVSNKNLALAMTDRAADMGDTGISFVTKSISNESYYESVTESSANLMRTIFMFIIPIAILGLGTVIFIKRRNA